MDDYRLNPEYRRACGFTGDAPLWISADGGVLLDRQDCAPGRMLVQVGIGDTITRHLDDAEAAGMAVAVLRALAVDVRSEWGTRTTQFVDGRRETWDLAWPRRERAEEIVALDRGNDDPRPALIVRDVLTLPGGATVVEAWREVDGG